MKHISFDEMIFAAENGLTGSQSLEIEGHIAVCDRCREVASGLKEVETLIGSLHERVRAGKDCPEDWEIGVFIRDELDKSRIEKVQGHIRTCGHCLERSAAYFKADGEQRHPVTAPEGWRLKAHLIGGRDAVTTGDIPLSERIFRPVKDFLGSLAPVPRYAFAAALVIVFLWILWPIKEGAMVIPSSEMVVYRESGPSSSLGFMGNERREDVEGMDITIKKDRLIFNWRPIEGTTDYSVMISESGKKNGVVPTLITAVPRVSVPKDAFSGDKRYLWTITGKNKDGESFEYKGEFEMKRSASVRGWGLSLFTGRRP